MNLFAQKSILQAGPTLGYNTQNQVTLLVQTKEKASIHYRYWPKGQADKAKESKTVNTNPRIRNRARVDITGLQAGLEYIYELYINGQKVEFEYPIHFHTKKEEGVNDFRMALGSCNFIVDERFDRKVANFGGKPHILTHIPKHDPDYMLWLGDNTYMRFSTHWGTEIDRHKIADWNSRDSMLERYTHTRSAPELQQLLSTTHHLAIWDDHDYGPDNSDRFWEHKDWSLEIFNSYWVNPPHPDPNREGIYTQYQVADVEFFLTDDRFFRAPGHTPSFENKPFFGKAQIVWLKEELKNSTATFKVIATGSQIVSDFDKGEGFRRQYEDEFNQIINFIRTEKVEGVVFVSGDKHMSEFSVYPSDELYPIYDVTVSPLTAFPIPPVYRTKNSFRVSGTKAYKHRNFGILDVKGEKGNRILEFKIYSTRNTLENTWIISESELKFK